LHSLPVPAATVAPVTPTTLPNAIRSTSRSIGRARERWPAGSHHHRTNILARMEPSKERLRLIRGSLELSDGPLRTAAVLYLHKLVSCTPASRPPLRYINRLFSARSGPSRDRPPTTAPGPAARTGRPWMVARRHAFSRLEIPRKAKPCQLLSFSTSSFWVERWEPIR
jgi:hypothetical protein